MNTLLEFHDSYVRCVTAGPQGLGISLSSACVHRSHGRAGFDQGECGMQPVDVLFGEACVERRDGKCLGKISDATVSVDGEEVDLT